MDFEIRNVLRFDTTENATDMQNLYVIETKDGKGLLVDMPVHGLNQEGKLNARKIGTNSEHYLYKNQPMKYGMEKAED